MSSNVLLKIEAVCKSYQMGLSQIKVLRGIDMSVREGDLIAIIGASGSGKSTLLHILGALDVPDSGTVSFRDRDLQIFSTSQLNAFRNKTVGFVFQFYHLLDELTVLENVYLPAMASKGVLGWLAARSAIKKRAAGLLAEVGLAERAGHRPFQLSGGERQRVAIARALINQPQLLLADEPTGNLDSATGNDILNIFERLNRAGQTIVMVTHDHAVAKRAGRIVTLVDGKIEHKSTVSAAK